MLRFILTSLFAFLAYLPFGFCQIAEQASPFTWSDQSIDLHGQFKRAFFKFDSIPVQEVAKQITQQLCKNKTCEVLFVDQLSNLIWIAGSEYTLAQIEQLKQHIDKDYPQIKVEVRVVIADEHLSQNIGAQIVSHETGTLSLLRWPNKKSLDVQLHAMQNQGHAKVIARPTLLCRHGYESSLESGEDIPYVQREDKTQTSVKFYKASLNLKVKPIIKDHNTILIDFDLKSGQKTTPSASLPSVAFYHIQNSMLVQSGDTVVIGGLFREDLNQSQYKIPLLHKIPILKHLLTQKTKTQKRHELLVFITAVINSDEKMSMLGQQSGKVE